MQDEDNVASGNTTVVRISAEHAIRQEKCIVITDALMSLLKELYWGICKQIGCGRVLEYSKTYVGTCLTVSWRCASGHKGGRSAAQPMCENLRAGNLLLASALLLSWKLISKSRDDVQILEVAVFF